MKNIPIAIAIVAFFASTTALADDDEDDEVWSSEGDVWFGDLYCYADEYEEPGDDPGGEWGWGWVGWIEIRDPGSCTAYDCSGRCDLWIYPCESGQCGDVIWSTCRQVGCDEFSNCA